MVFHVTPSSYRVYLSPREVLVLRGSLKLWDEHHESVRGPSDVPMWLVPFCAMLWVQSAMVGSNRHHMFCLCLKLSWCSPSGQRGLQ